MKFEYTPKGVCSRKMIFNIENDKIESFEVVGGCNGNLKGIASLLKDMKVDDAIGRLRGIKCGIKDTSCPDQISKALEEFKTLA